MGTTLHGDKLRLLSESLPTATAWSGLRKTAARTSALFSAAYIEREWICSKELSLGTVELIAPRSTVSMLETLWFPAAGQQTPDPESHPFTLFCSGLLQTPRRQPEIQIWKGDLSARKDLGWKCEFGAVILWLIMRSMYLIFTSDIVTS